MWNEPHTTIVMGDERWGGGGGWREESNTSESLVELPANLAILPNAGTIHERHLALHLHVGPQGDRTEQHRPALDPGHRVRRNLLTRGLHTRHRRARLRNRAQFRLLRQRQRPQRRAVARPPARRGDQAHQQHEA